VAWCQLPVLRWVTAGRRADHLARTRSGRMAARARRAGRRAGTRNPPRTGCRRGWRTVRRWWARPRCPDPERSWAGSPAAAHHRARTRPGDAAPRRAARPATPLPRWPPTPASGGWSAGASGGWSAGAAASLLPPGAAQEPESRAARCPAAARAPTAGCRRPSLPAPGSPGVILVPAGRRCGHRRQARVRQMPRYRRRLPWPGTRSEGSPRCPGRGSAHWDLPESGPRAAHPWEPGFRP
jgi:hypothetical protein